MSPLDEATIRRKTAIIIENLKALLPIQGMSAEEKYLSKYLPP